VLSLLVALGDRLWHSSCGLRCGFRLDDTVPTFANPIDQLLLALSRYFPLDYMAFSFICLYIFAASVYGVIRIGIRFCGITLFEIRPRRTWSSSLLIVVVVLMCILLALMCFMLVLAPQYMTFGSQMYHVDEAQLHASATAVAANAANTGEAIPCTLTALAALRNQTSSASSSPSSSSSSWSDPLGSSTSTSASSSSARATSCEMTHISLFLHRLTDSVPLIAVLFYLAYCTFLAVTVLGSLYESCRDKSSSLWQSPTDDPDDEDDGDVQEQELDSLVDGGREDGSV